MLVDQCNRRFELLYYNAMCRTGLSIHLHFSYNICVLRISTICVATGLVET